MRERGERRCSSPSPFQFARFTPLRVCGAYDSRHFFRPNIFVRLTALSISHDLSPTLTGERLSEMKRALFYACSSFSRFPNAVAPSFERKFQLHLLWKQQTRFLRKRRRLWFCGLVSALKDFGYIPLFFFHFATIMYISLRFPVSIAYDLLVSSLVRSSFCTVETRNGI